MSPFLEIAIIKYGECGVFDKSRLFLLGRGCELKVWHSFYDKRYNKSQ